jgi:hypothetical protein
MKQGTLQEQPMINAQAEEKKLSASRSNVKMKGVMVSRRMMKGHAIRKRLIDNPLLA